MKYVAVAALALLAGCAITTVEDREATEPDFVVSSRLPVTAVAECIYPKWANMMSTERLDTADGGIKLFNRAVGATRPHDVTRLVTIYPEDGGSNVAYYSFFSWKAENTFMKYAKECAAP